MPRTNETKEQRSARAKADWASHTPEERAARRERISAGVREAMPRWQAGRTPEHKETACQRIKAAALCHLWTPVTRNNPNAWPKGRRPVGNVSPSALARRELTKVQKASVKRIMADLVGTQPELVRDALIEGLQARPPFSVPYLVLASAYLDGKPIDANPDAERGLDLSGLTREQLVARALEIAQTMQEKQQSELAVIDITAGREPTLQELQSQIEQAQEEVRLAEAEVRRLKGNTK
jgi:hypothetical protein